MQQITSTTPTICGLMRVPLPRLSTSSVLQSVLDEASRVVGTQPVEKFFAYAPDAIGEMLFRDYAGEFESVLRVAPVHVLLSSVFPSVTPVCFASMFTGAMPKEHGIRIYEKPVLSCDTIFDAFVRAGKKVAIVSTQDSSISRIFLNRPISYFTEKYDQEVNTRLLQLLQGDGFDFMLAYNQEYDDAMHRTTPRSEEALRAMMNHLRNFELLANAFLKRYEHYNRAIVFCPDHGAHIRPETGRGSHGRSLPEDMEVRSFWGIYSGVS